MSFLNNATGYWNGDYGSTPIYSAGTKGDNEILPEEKKILRGLAKKVAEIAGKPIEKEKIELWKNHNLLKSTRPLIFCDPENGWNEIIFEDDLKCQNTLAKNWEMVLLKEIFWGEKMQDDKPVEPKFDIAYTYTESNWGIEEKFHGGTDGGSYVWEPCLKKYSDIDKLRFPKIEIDQETTRLTIELANDVFGDILNVRLIGKWWWSTGMTYQLVLLRGMQQIMVDMINEPKFVHELMQFIMEGTLSRLEFLENNDLLSLNNDLYGGPGGFNHTDELPKKDFKDHVRLEDIWGYAESQETVGVSPGMFEEFVFKYQMSIMERFGLNSYGCCEPLDGRWEIIKNTPKLRKVVVSPWADRKIMADNLTDKYCYVLKPHPADIAIPNIDKKKIRDDLRETFVITKDCRVQVFMSDNHTIGKNPQNVIDWARIAKEEAERTNNEK